MNGVVASIPVKPIKAIFSEENIMPAALQRYCKTNKCAGIYRTEKLCRRYTGHVILHGRVQPGSFAGKSYLYVGFGILRAQAYFT